MSPRGVTRKLARHLFAVVTFELVVGFLISLGTLWAFEELSDEVFEGETQRIDTITLVWINSVFPAWLGLPMRWLTALGYSWAVTPLLLLSAYVFYRRNLKVSAGLLLVSVPGAAILGIALKFFYQRPRPELFDLGYYASLYSFPSGHAVVAVSFYGLLTLLITRRLEGWRRWTVGATGTVFVLLIGFSRLYLGVHYPSDILAGYLTAALWVASVGAALALWRSLRKQR